MEEALLKLSTDKSVDVVVIVAGQFLAWPPAGYTPAAPTASTVTASS